MEGESALPLSIRGGKKKGGLPPLAEKRREKGNLLKKREESRTGKKRIQLEKKSWFLSSRKERGKKGKGPCFTPQRRAD